METFFLFFSFFLSLHFFIIYFLNTHTDTFLYFAIFIFLGLFFFLNLVLAIVTNSFSIGTTKEMEEYADKKLFMVADSFAKVMINISRILSLLSPLRYYFDSLGTIQYRIVRFSHISSFFFFFFFFFFFHFIFFIYFFFFYFFS